MTLKLKGDLVILKMYLQTEKLSNLRHSKLIELEMEKYKNMSQG